VFGWTGGTNNSVKNIYPTIATSSLRIRIIVPSGIRALRAEAASRKACSLKLPNNPGFAKVALQDGRLSAP
jgi:hypothetical protein